MSNRTDGSDGGPAFAHGSPEHGGHPGMSLRDWYAGQALAAIIGKNLILEDDEHRAEKIRAIAEASYEYADAMLAERDR